MAKSFEECQQQADQNLQSALASAQEAQHAEIGAAVHKATEAIQAENDKLASRVAQLMQELETLTRQHAEQLEALRAQHAQAMQQEMYCQEQQQQEIRDANDDSQPSSNSAVHEQLQQAFKVQEQEMIQMRDQYMQEKLELEGKAQALLQQVQSLNDAQASLTIELEAAQQAREKMITLRLEAPTESCADQASDQQASVAADTAQLPEAECLRKQQLQQASEASSRQDEQISNLQAEVQSALQAQSEAVQELAICRTQLEAIGSQLKPGVRS